MRHWQQWKNSVKDWVCVESCITCTVVIMFILYIEQVKNSSGLERNFLYPLCFFILLAMMVQRELLYYINVYYACVTPSQLILGIHRNIHISLVCFLPEIHMHFIVHLDVSWENLWVLILSYNLWPIIHKARTPLWLIIYNTRHANTIMGWTWGQHADAALPT